MPPAEGDHMPGDRLAAPPATDPDDQGACQRAESTERVKKGRLAGGSVDSPPTATATPQASQLVANAMPRKRVRSLR